MKTNDGVFELELSAMEFWFLLNQFSPCYILGFDNVYQGLLSEEKKLVYKKSLDDLSKRDIIRILSPNELAIESTIAELFNKLIASSKTLIISFKNKKGTYFHYFDFCKDEIIHRTNDGNGKYTFRKANDHRDLNKIFDELLNGRYFELTKIFGKIANDEFTKLVKGTFDGDIAVIRQVLDKNNTKNELSDEIIGGLMDPFVNLSFTLMSKNGSTNFCEIRGFGLLLGAFRIWLIENNTSGNHSSISIESISTIELDQKLSKVIPNFGGLRMHHLIITLKVGSKSKTLEVPGDEPVGVLKEHIIKGFGGKVEGSQGNLINYWLETQSGKKIEDVQTLLDAGIKNHDVLQIRRHSGVVSNNSQEPYFDSLSSLFDDSDDEANSKVQTQTPTAPEESSIGGFDTLD